MLVKFFNIGGVEKDYGEGIVDGSQFWSVRYIVLLIISGVLLKSVLCLLYLVNFICVIIVKFKVYRWFQKFCVFFVMCLRFFLIFCFCLNVGFCFFYVGFLIVFFGMFIVRSCFVFLVYGGYYDKFFFLKVQFRYCCFFLN